MKTQIEQITKFVSVEPSEIISVYTAKADGCKCGCNGTYWYASAHRNYAGSDRGYPVLDDEVSDSEVTRIAKILNKNAGMVEITGDCILNYKTPTGRIYTAYIKAS